MKKNQFAVWLDTLKGRQKTEHDTAGGAGVYLNYDVAHGIRGISLKGYWNLDMKRQEIAVWLENGSYQTNLGRVYVCAETGKAIFENAGPSSGPAE